MEEARLSGAVGTGMPDDGGASMITAEDFLFLFAGIWNDARTAFLNKAGA